MHGDEAFKSVVVHEIVHAVMHQNVGPHGMGYVAGEYLAYALQMEALPGGVRHRVLGSIPVGSADSLVFTGVMLHLEAFRFAALAYAHFKASPDRCGRLRALMTGEVPFVQSEASF